MGKKPYKCDDCGLLYEDSGWAKKCYEWCTKHHSCNLGITRHSIKQEGAFHPS